MRFGCCAGIEKAKFLADTGFDFIELRVAWLASLEDGEFKRDVVEFFEGLNIKPEAFNVFVPSEIKLTGDNVDQGKAKDYLEKAISRVSKVGGKVIVFGSGGARTIPDGFSREAAWDQLKWFLNQAGETAEKVGITIAIEPLNRKESNIFNSVKEALRMAKEVNHNSIRVLADLYHVVLEEEPFSNIADAGNLLAHVHVADTDRKFPGSGSYDYPGFKKALSEAGYNKRISIECRWDNFEEEAPKALEYLRKIFT